MINKIKDRTFDVNLVTSFTSSKYLMDEIAKFRLPSSIAGLDARALCRLCEHFTLFGMPYYTARSRIQKGFREWEIIGVDGCMTEFDPECNQPDGFFREAGGETRSAFATFMESRGMSRKTVYSRFYDFNFREWERMGVDAVVDSYHKSREKV